MEAIFRKYHEVFYEKADPRCKDWPLMSSPWSIVTIIVTYLIIIKLILPMHMKDKKPYNLRLVMKWYNIIQILANAVVSWGILTSGWTTTYHFGCMLPDYSMNPEALRMLRFLWWTLLIKIFEMLETMFYILRKKDRQASFLHVYHHISTMTFVWMAVKYVGGGITSFSPMLNNAVHVIMYSYYLLSAEGSPRTKQFLTKHKKWLTTFQMVQFTVILVYSSQIFLPSCPAPLGVGIMYIPNVVLVYYMFYNFYINNYTTKCNVNGNSVKTN
ncbi:elongation of very long chain fatty acids protein 7-like [Achroia grisella]|uniref:elongation of very long chain fatty acids protein 7-like n=1 Tax=Achroia grisella TaxID=688607 RepID=UPI0027D22CE8|nr:elongation of very long chain fatty acids protein 7-like [Achroia grisella]